MNHLSRMASINGSGAGVKLKNRFTSYLEEEVRK